MKAHLTAKGRKSPSKPMQFLSRKDLLIGRSLDFGCGKGFDAKHFKMESYDPHFQPKLPKGKFDTITCNYVLNVIEDHKIVLDVIDKLKSLLKNKGTCYITVRRDIIKEGCTSKGTYQKNIVLNLPTLVENKSFCIYILKKEDTP